MAGSSSSSESLGLSSQSSEIPDHCADGKRRIKLEPFFQKRFEPAVHDGFRIRLVASEACRMPLEVFRYLRHPPDAVTGISKDEFTGVCSAIDLEELGVDEPTPGQSPPCFRSAVTDLVFESAHRAEEAWQIILEEVTSLKNTLDLMDVLEALEPEWVGDAP